jgi:CheY-like chemotaxis protein
MAEGNRPRVLVADDHPASADSLGMLLGLWGYEARVCYDGPTALQTALAFNPQIVLLEVGMPGMSNSLVAHIRQERPGFEGARVIGMSGDGDERGRVLAGSFNHILPKPMEIDHLQEMLRG